MKIIDQRNKEEYEAQVGDVVIDSCDEMYFIIDTYDCAKYALLSISDMDIRYQDESIKELLDCITVTEIVPQEKLSITLT